MSDLVYYLVYNIIMKSVNIHDAKTHLSKYLELVAKGETIILCRRNIPIAELKPIRPEGKRRLGQAAGQVKINPEFFDPLPKDLLALFNLDEENRRK